MPEIECKIALGIRLFLMQIVERRRVVFSGRLRNNPKIIYEAREA
jgi:hypothetical protein